MPALLIGIGCVVATQIIGECILIKIYNDRTRREKYKHLIKKIHRKKENKDDDCIICLENFEKNNKCVTLHCNHVYHKKCIEEWFDSKLVCPLCNQ